MNRILLSVAAALRILPIVSILSILTILLCSCTPPSASLSTQSQKRHPSSLPALPSEWSTPGAVDIDAISSRIGTRPNRHLAREIARDAVTLLRNKNGLLPLPPDGPMHIVALLAGDTEDDRSDVDRPGSPATSEPVGTYFSHLLRRRSAGSEILRLSLGSDTREVDGAVARIRRADVALLCLFVKVRTASGRIDLPDYLRTFAARVAETNTPLVVLAFGNPYMAGNVPDAGSIMCLYGDDEPVSEAAAVIDTIAATPLVAAPGDSTIYSDLGFITLGKIVEKVSGMPLDAFVKKEFFIPLRMRNTTFAPPESLRARCAPTEIDTVWRKSVVQGSVHDENAAFIGGVSGNAGLFSTASDLAVYMQMLFNKGMYAGRRYLSEKTIAEFIERRSPVQERWLGWDTRSPRGSSAGAFFSPASFGHTGFTGTCIWADPARNLVVIFLTNRVYPTRANLKIARVRPAVNDAVMRALGVPGTGQ